MGRSSVPYYPRRMRVFTAAWSSGAECPRCAVVIAYEDLCTVDRHGQVNHADCEDPRGARDER
jgi:hypothetical protein